MSRLREKIESIVFAGLKSSGQKQQAAVRPPETWLGRSRARIDGWISGGAPSDPLYLSNRTTAQKLRSWSVVAIPILVLMVAVGISLSSFLNPPEAKQAKELSGPEVAAKLLPNLKDFKIEAPRDVEVSEVRVDRGPRGVRIVGILKNNATRPFAAADINCDVTDSNGGQLGSVSIHVDDLPASGTKAFELPLKQLEANFVLIRQIATR